MPSAVQHPSIKEEKRFERKRKRKRFQQAQTEIGIGVRFC
jgi:hypothetical protein